MSNKLVVLAMSPERAKHVRQAVSNARQAGLVPGDVMDVLDEIDNQLRPTRAQNQYPDEKES